LSEKHPHISDNENSKTCTRLVTRKKFFGLVGFPRDDIETLRITNKINAPQAQLNVRKNGQK
jgi:hypothetical protein